MYSKNLSENSPTTFCIIGIGDGGYFGGSIAGTVFATDGGHVQVQQSEVLFAATRYYLHSLAVPLQVDVKCGSNGPLTSVQYTAEISPDGHQILLKCKAISPLAQTVLKLNWQWIHKATSPDAIITPV
jgi:hypothetical protein